MLWLLHVKDLAQGCPFGSVTPHCRSTSTGPFGLAAFGFGSSFFFFALPLSSSPSAFLFLPLTALSVFLPAAFLVVLPAFSPFLSMSSSASLSSSPRASASPSALRASSSRAASFARSRASRASFLRCAFSFLMRRH